MGGMLYLIDGYNVTRSDPATRDRSLEEQREGLLARLRSRGRDLLGAGRIIVVFDGAGGSGVSRVPGSPVEVRFSRDATADDEIAALAASSRESICLVTSDSDLRERVRAHATGSVTVKPREALYDAAGRGSRRTRGGRFPGSTAGMPKGANRITEELKKLWLDDEE